MTNDVLTEVGMMIVPTFAGVAPPPPRSESTPDTTYHFVAPRLVPGGMDEGNEVP